MSKEQMGSRGCEPCNQPKVGDQGSLASSFLQLHRLTPPWVQKRNVTFLMSHSSYSSNWIQVARGGSREAQCPHLKREGVSDGCDLPGAGVWGPGYPVPLEEGRLEDSQALTPLGPLDLHLGPQLSLSFLA